MAMTLRLPDELNDQLRQVAKEEGTSLQQAAVTAIAEYVERREEARAKALFERVAERDANLLHRLGTV